MAKQTRPMTTTTRDWVTVLGLLVVVSVLMRWMECRYSQPASYVQTVLYDQENNTYLVETKHRPWWSLRGPPQRVRFQTTINNERFDGLIPAAEFRPWDVVELPDQDQFWPHYIRYADLPEGMWYAPATPWHCPSQLTYEGGEWRLGLMKIHLRNRDPLASVLLTQYSALPNPPKNSWGYAFHTGEMGGIMSRGLGQINELSANERVRQIFSRLPFMPK